MEDQRTETFLRAFKRFTSRHSTPRLILSDNARYFKGASETLKKIYNHPTLQNDLSLQRVEWRFIPSRAPRFGGFWERLVALIKNHIKKVLGRSHLTFDQLHTLITEIEAVIHDRPLKYSSGEIDDSQPLTPAHLLAGRRLSGLPEPAAAGLDRQVIRGASVSASELRSRYRHQLELLEHFWNRWRNEYLTALREKHRGSRNANEVIKEGDVVLVHDDGPGIPWRLARVVALHRGRDNRVRSAKITSGGTDTIRPIARLYRLETGLE